MLTVIRPGKPLGMAISPAQCRAARALLFITQDELSKRSGVSQRSIANFELGKSTPYRANLTVLQMTFEKLGVEFLDHDGVRRKPGSQEDKK